MLTERRRARRIQFWWVACLIFLPYVAVLLPYTWRKITAAPQRVLLWIWAGVALIIGVLGR